MKDSMKERKMIDAASVSATRNQSINCEEIDLNNEQCPIFNYYMNMYCSIFDIIWHYIAYPTISHKERQLTTAIKDFPKNINDLNS